MNLCGGSMKVISLIDKNQTCMSHLVLALFKIITSCLFSIFSYIFFAFAVTLAFALHLSENVLAQVPHWQFVFTILKWLRIYFRYDRKLLGKLAHAAWETVRDVFLEEVSCDDIVFPAMIAGIQTFGDLINFYRHHIPLGLKIAK
jgi:hypothetical protein